MNEKKITQVINYKTDADGHHLSMTACPYWRMNHHGITDGAKYVGTMECEGCRWYCSKDVEARTIECAIPAKLAARYERGRLVSVVAYFDRPSSSEKRQKKE